MQAIIYRRFSSREQGRGSTLTRQSSICEAYCAAKGWQVVQVISDEGVSAWSGANIETGNLAKLTKALSADGEGKVIVVEQLDRITRQPPNKVIGWLTLITDAGAALATANDDTLITSASFSANPMATMGLVFNAYRAFSESQHKSERLSAAWANKREVGGAMTGRCVAWLRLANGAFEVIPERAEIVQRIFALAIDGFGPTRIAQALNREGVEPFGKSSGWQISYIKKILANRAVLGEFQPCTKPRAGKRQPVGDAIPDYYPQIVSERDFALVQSQRPTVRQAASRGFVNILSGLAVCKCCGGSVIYLNRGIERLADGREVRREYLQCEQSRRGLCEGKTAYPYAQTVNRILDGTLAAALKGSAQPDERLRQLENEALGLERQSSDAQARAQRLLSLYEEGDDAAGERYRVLRESSRSLGDAAKVARDQLEAERAKPSVADIAGRVKALRGALDEDEGARREVKFALDRFLNSVEFDPEAGDYFIDCSAEILLHFDFELAPFWQRAAEGAKAHGGDYTGMLR